MGGNPARKWTSRRTYGIIFLGYGTGTKNPKDLSAYPLFGDPDFGAAVKVDNVAASRLRGVSFDLSSEEITSLKFSSLPGTAKECGEIKSLAESRKYPAESCLGENASEKKLRDVHKPWILHMATHGFFIPSMEKDSESRQASLFESKHGKAVNPMLRSGLALSGANVTLEAWKRNETRGMENDGIVYAEEVGALDLDGTWLVVLSACETGLGEARAGEGILGLRRGFVQAGARNLMMTLWSISDKPRCVSWRNITAPPGIHMMPRNRSAMCSAFFSWSFEKRRASGTR